MEYEEKAWTIYRFDDINDNVSIGNNINLKLYAPPI